MNANGCTCTHASAWTHTQGTPLKQHAVEGNSTVPLSQNMPLMWLKESFDIGTHGTISMTHTHTHTHTHRGFPIKQ